MLIKNNLYDILMSINNCPHYLYFIVGPFIASQGESGVHSCFLV